MMKDSTSIRSKYDQARFETCEHMSRAVRSLAEAIEFTRNPERRELGPFYKLVDVYDRHLKTKMSDAVNLTYRSLAMIDAHTTLHDNLVVQFDELPQDFVKRAQREIHLQDMIDRERMDIASTGRLLGEFCQKFAVETAAERSSFEYTRDLEIIRNAQNDLALAVHGRWTPDFVTIEDYNSTGRSKDIERPNSAALSSIAQSVRSGKLRLPAKLFSLEG